MDMPYSLPFVPQTRQTFVEKWIPDIQNEKSGNHPANQGTCTVAACSNIAHIVPTRHLAIGTSYLVSINGKISLEATGNEYKWIHAQEEMCRRRGSVWVLRWHRRTETRANIIENR